MPTKMASTKEKTWWFDSNVPVTQGDSGGPAFYEAGKLLGCVSVVNLWRLPFSRKSGNRWTSVAGTESGEIQQTIAADRARLKKNLDAVYKDKALLKEIEAITGANRSKVQQLVEKLMAIKDGFSKR
jgi:hypothetical protein